MKIRNVIMVIALVLGLAFAFTSPVFAQGEEPPINIGEISPDTVIAFLAVGMALLFDYAPGVAQWYEKLSESNKKLVALGLAVFVVAVAFGLTCAGVFTSNLVCTSAGVWDALSNVIYVIAIQYGFHKATKPSTAFKKKSYLNMKTTSKGH